MPVIIVLLSVVVAFSGRLLAAEQPALEILNRGIGGNNTQQALARLDADVLASHPTHVVVYFGMNDAINSKNAVPVAMYRTNLLAIVDRIAAAGARPLLVTITPVIEACVLARHDPAFFAGRGGPNGVIEAYNEVVRAVAAERAVPLIDLWSAFRERGEPQDAPGSLLRTPASAKIADGVHYLATGNRVFAGLVFTALRPTLGSSPRVVCFGDSLTFGVGAVGANTVTGETYPAFLADLARQADRRGSAPFHLVGNGIRMSMHEPVHGGGIASITDERGHEFINGVGSSGLWRITLRRIPTPVQAPRGTVDLDLDPERADAGAPRSEEIGGSGDRIELCALQVAARCAVERQPGRLILRWDGIDVGDEPGVLDVWVSVGWDATDGFLRFRSGIANRSRFFTVFSLAAPLVEGLAAEDGRSDLDRLATPAGDGRLVIDPIRYGILGGRLRVQPNRSGHSMQFDAYYHRDHGLFLGCQDGDENVKRYQLSARADGIGWSVIHLPNTMKQVPQAWKTPYDTVLRCFRGDWFAAAAIYRQWALRQSWTAAGPLAGRGIPAWFAEMDEWLLWSVDKDQSAIHDERTRTLLSGTAAGVLTYHWSRTREMERGSPDVLPVDARTVEYLKGAAAAGMPAMGYLQGVCWDPETDSYRRLDGGRHTVRDFSGRALVWRLPGCTPAIAMPGEAWLAALTPAVEGMVRLGFRAIYLDSGNHGGTYLNFNDDGYGADVGGGTAYIHGQRRVIARLKEAARRIDPEVCFTAESFWEGNMAELDAFMSCNTTNEHLSEHGAEAIPLVHAVYHDRTILFSAWVNRQDVEQSGAMGYVAKFGQAFIWGVKPGWNIPAQFLTYGNADIAWESSRRRYLAYRSAREFLTYGTMLREPAAMQPIPREAVRWGVGWGPRAYDITLPSVMVSAWRSPSGRLGLVLYNISAVPRRVSVLLTPADHGVAPSGPCTLDPVFSAHGTASAVRVHEGVAVDCSIDPRSPLVLALDR